MSLPKGLSKLLLGLLVILSIISGLSVVWVLDRHQDRTEYVEELTRPSTSISLSLKWQTTLGYSTYDSPAYQGDLVLMPANNLLTSSWYGLDINTGSIIWQIQTAEYSLLRCLTSKYLILSGPLSFLSIESSTGKLIWQKGKAETASCSPDKVFYSEVPRYSISAADLTTGQDIWIGTNPYKDFFNGVIYNPETDEVIANRGYFYIIDPQTGLLRDKFSQIGFPPTDGGQRDAMYLVDQGELFISGNVLNAQTGEVIHYEERFESARPPTVTADTIYLPALSDGVVAFDRTTYEVKWIYPSPLNKSGTHRLETISSVAILNGIGYVIFADATLRAFDLETGQELGYWQPSADDLWDWRVCTYPHPRADCIKSARAGLATSEDTLFVSFGDGKLYAFGKGE